MEGIDNNWDELLHDTFHYPVDTLGHPESISALHAYDFELGSGFWASQAVLSTHYSFLISSADMTLLPFSAQLVHFPPFRHIRQNRAIRHQRSLMITYIRQTN